MILRTKLCVPVRLYYCTFITLSQPQPYSYRHCKPNTPGWGNSKRCSGGTDPQERGNACALVQCLLGWSDCHSQTGGSLSLLFDIVMRFSGGLWNPVANSTSTVIVFHREYHQRLGFSFFCRYSQASQLFGSLWDQKIDQAMLSLFSSG